MTHYNDSRWADPEFSDMYANNADDIIQERRRLIGVLLSYYGKFYGEKNSVRTLDLGCGDGTITHELAGRFGNTVPALLDGSDDMLAKAKSLLGGVEGARFIKASFEELLSGEVTLDSGYDFIFSSLAIHHLYAEQKAGMYRLAYESLRPGGSFVNIDVVHPASARLEEWYLDTWRAYLRERASSGEFEDFTKLYKENPDNKPDTLDSQLAMLKDAGFAEVDCHYKDGIFAVFGGVRPAG